jgi:hypothetical protein
LVGGYVARVPVLNDDQKILVTVEERVSATGYCSAGFHLEEWVNESNAIAGFDFARFRTIG